MAFKRLIMSAWFPLIITITSVLLGYALNICYPETLASWVAAIGTTLSVGMVGVQINIQRNLKDSERRVKARPIFAVSGQHTLKLGDVLWSPFSSINSKWTGWQRVRIINGQVARNIVVKVTGENTRKTKSLNSTDYEDKSGDRVQIGQNHTNVERRLFVIPAIFAETILLDTHYLKNIKINMLYQTASGEFNEMIVDQSKHKYYFAEYNVEDKEHKIYAKYKEILAEMDSLEVGVMHTNGSVSGSYSMYADEAFFEPERRIDELEREMNSRPSDVK